MNFKKS